MKAMSTSQSCVKATSSSLHVQAMRTLQRSACEGNGYCAREAINLKAMNTSLRHAVVRTP